MLEKSRLKIFACLLTIVGLFAGAEAKNRPRGGADPQHGRDRFHGCQGERLLPGRGFGCGPGRDEGHTRHIGV